MQIREICVGLSLASFCGLAANAEETQTETRHRGTLSFVYENDWVDGGKDRNYTNGLRLSYISDARPTSGYARWVTQNLMNAEDGTDYRLGLAFGHSLFTPNNIEASEPLPDEHPYAGWLYGEFTVLSEIDDMVDQFTVQLGIVGPSAGGEWVQNEVHKIVGADIANGWDNQIDNEVGFSVSYDRRFRVRKSFDIPFMEQLQTDFIPSAGVTLGTVLTSARVGGTFRVGKDLTTDYGPARVRPSLAGAAHFDRKDEFNWYLFAGVEGRAVAHNIFLDGSLFNDGPSVSSNDFVADFQTGLAVQVYDLRFSTTYVERTLEFNTQEGAQRFIAFSLSRKLG